MNKDPRSFDPTKPLVVSAFAQVHEHDLTVGTEVKIVEEQSDPPAPGEVTLDEAIHLWRADKIDYTENARPTPVASPEDEAERLTEIERLSKNKFLIRAPWLAEGETITGREEAAKRYAEVVQQGIDDPTPVAPMGVTVEAETEDEVDDTPQTFGFKEAGSNGYYEITGPNLKPYKVRGEAAAQAEVERLTAGTPPIIPTDVVKTDAELKKEGED